MILVPLLASMIAAASPSDAEVEKDTQAWQATRNQRLLREDGWLSLVGLDWLEEGDAPAGSAASNKVVLPASVPAKLGTFRRKGSSVWFWPAAGVIVTKEGKPFPGGELRTDEGDAKPDVLQFGTVRFQIISRGDRLAVRSKDSQSPARKSFHTIPAYPALAKWRVEAKLEPTPNAPPIPVPTVLGTIEPMPSPGTLVFTLEGKEYRLTPVLEPDEPRLFIVFSDQTNRTDTYGAGRFLYAPPLKDGRTVIDFNQAYNPPCAFTAFATCPLPPKGNRLPIRVEAGEKRYSEH